jgi:DNA primase small subunit
MSRFNDTDSQGWSKRIRDGADDMMEKLQGISNQQGDYSSVLKDLEHGLKSQYEREGPTSQRSAASIKKLADLVNHEARANRIIGGNFGALGAYQGLFLNLLKTDSSVVLGNAGETDEVVTIDTRRQIRWPTSLHGKTGMRVSEFPLERLDPDGSNPYRPLIEAMALGGQDKLRVEIIVDDAIAEFEQKRYDLSMGQNIELGEAGATFLVLKGWAKIA